MAKRCRCVLIVFVELSVDRSELAGCYDRFPIRSLQSTREFALAVTRQSENAVVPSWPAAVLLGLHLRHPPALVEIETAVSVQVSPGISDRYRLVVLLPLASLLWLRPLLPYDRGQVPSLTLIVAPNKPGR